MPSSPSAGGAAAAALDSSPPLADVVALSERLLLAVAWLAKFRSPGAPVSAPCAALSTSTSGASGGLREATTSISWDRRALWRRLPWRLLSCDLVASSPGPASASFAARTSLADSPNGRHSLGPRYCA